MLPFLALQWDAIPLGMGQMTIVTVTERLKAIRRTKLYDLFAAAPLIALYVFCAAQDAAIGSSTDNAD